MLRSSKVFLIALLAIFTLSACGQSTQEKATKSIEKAEKAFHAEPAERNEEVNGIEFYKPTRYTIDESSDEQNIVLKKDDDLFILFINPKESNDSKLFYELLLEQKRKVIAEKVLSTEEMFGFISIMETAEEDVVELIASVGGAKISTQTTTNKMKTYLPEMMDIVRSIK